MSRLLTIALLAPGRDSADRKHEKRYATIRFPESYEAAVEGAIKAMRLYIPAHVQIGDVEVLYPVAGLNDGETVWSTFYPEDWSLVVEEMFGKMLGIRQKAEQGITAPIVEANMPFVIGQVGVSYGVSKNATTSWSRISVSPPNVSPSINRPKTYQEAVDYIKLYIANDNFGQFPALRTAGLVKDLNGVDFKFHAFVSSQGGRPTTDHWIDFPESAYTNGAIWRLFVPKASEILGFTLHERQTPPSY